MNTLNNLFASNLNAIFHVGGKFSIKKGMEWKLTSDFFGQNKFYYIKSGGCKIIIRGKEYEGIPGRWFFIPACTPHSYANDTTKPFSKYWIHFDLYPDNSIIFGNMDIPYYVDVKHPAKIDKLFQIITAKADGDKAAEPFYKKAALLSLIGEYIETASPDTKMEHSNDDVSRVVEYVNENIEQNIKLEELAKVCHLHPTHFIRSFKKKTGETPLYFVQRRKMETAKRLIEETQMSLGEIMNRVGFVDAAQFSKKFKRFYGHSPRDFRRAIRDMNETFKK
jgi:AraC-like DNA-binding protein